MRKMFMGCAVMGLIALSPRPEARTPALPGPSPLVLPRAHGEVGLASWYGMERQGKLTASGALFDKDKFTAAHRKLPFGSRVRVTNLRNHESAMLEINDRGPGIPSRVIDLSWAAAKKLGYIDAGLAYVEIDIISSPIRCLQQATCQRSPKLN